MLNKALIQVLAYVVLLAIAFIAILLYKSKCKEYKTLDVEHNLLRNRYNALQQDYTAYKFAQQKKEEANAQTQQALADIATASSNELADQLQHRKNRVRNKDSSSNI